MKFVDYTCPNCGAQLSVDADRQQAFCQYCGSKLLLDDENTIRIQKRIIDEARIKEAEVRLKELEFEKEITQASAKERKTWRLLFLIYIGALGLSFTFLSSQAFVLILIFGACAIMVLRPHTYREGPESVSGKNRIVALILCFFFGIFGAHYFYVGRIGMGLLYFFTFGLGGMGWLVDLIRIAVGVFRDKDGRLLN